MTGTQRNGCSGLRAFHSLAVEMKNEEALDLVCYSKELECYSEGCGIADCVS